MRLLDMVFDTSMNNRPDGWGAENDSFESLPPGKEGGPIVDDQAIEDLVVYLLGNWTDSPDELRERVAMLDSDKVEETWLLVVEFDAWRQSYIDKEGKWDDLLEAKMALDEPANDRPDDWGDGDNFFKPLPPGKEGGPTVDDQAVQDLVVYSYGQCVDCPDKLQDKAALIDSEKIKKTWHFVVEYASWRRCFINQKLDVAKSFGIID